MEEEVEEDADEVGEEVMVGDAEDKEEVSGSCRGESLWGKEDSV